MTEGPAAIPPGVALACTVAIGLVLLGLLCLSRPAWRLVGCRLAMAGMALAAGTVICIHNAAALPQIVLATGLGGGIGLLAARNVPVSALPILLCAFPLLAGLAEIAVSAAAFFSPASFPTGSGGAMLAIGASLGAVIVGASSIVLAGLFHRQEVPSVKLALLNGGVGWTSCILGLALHNILMIAIGALAGVAGAMMAVIFGKAAKGRSSPASAGGRYGD